MKITFGIIVLNGDFFIRQVLESIYEVAHAICIAEGPVEYHFKNGVITSTDETISIIRDFPDPQNKIKFVQGVYGEKTEQCRAWFDLVPSDTDYIICNDADEVHTPENMEKLIKFLEKENPTSVGFKSDSFFGGFEKIIGGFERDHSFKRVLKYYPGTFYKTHRQPTLATVDPNGSAIHEVEGKDITGNQLYDATGITMWHGSYVSPKGVYEKIRYYENAVIAPGQCIENYFHQVWLNWVLHPDLRDQIESRFNGVQEFKPTVRGECKTIPFTGTHPQVIQKSMPELLAKFESQLQPFIQNYETTL